MHLNDPEHSGSFLEPASGGAPLDRLSEVSDVLSEGSETWDPNAGELESPALDEDAPVDREELTEVEKVLEGIFDYYTTQGASTLREPRLTNARFQRMAMDAALVDGKLTSAKVDVAFSRTCKGSPHMNKDQFRDVMVRLAIIKYPQMASKQHAVVKLFREHLAAFSGVNASSAIFACLKPEALTVIQAARPGLQTVYDAYLGAKKLTQRRASTVEGETQGAFVQFLIDFEVTPELSPKSTVYHVLREVLRAREIPADLVEQIGGDGGNHASSFTYVHFGISIALLAQRCFADDSAQAVVRLLEWMDASKGRVVFGASFPGRLPGGSANFKILPDSLATIHVPSTASTPPPRGSVLAAAGGAKAAASKQMEARSSKAAGVDARKRSSSSGRVGGSEIARGPGDGASLSAAQTAVASSKPPPGVGGSAGSSTGSGAAQAAAQNLPDWARRLVQQTFGHYAALGDPLNRTVLSSLKFNRFLRDCGLMSSEAPGAAVGFDYAPEGRRRSTAAATGTRGSVAGASSGGSASSSQNLGRPRFSVSRSRASLAGAAGDGAEGGAGTGLPLQVFAKPPLTKPQADLVFVQAARFSSMAAAAAAASTAGNSGRRSTTTGATRASVSSSGGSRHSLTVDGFCQAMADIAVRCTPPEESVSAGQALEDFCQRVLVPLNELLVEAQSGDISVVADLVAKPQAQTLLQRCRPGIEKLFQYYLNDAAGRKAIWLSESMVRFASDFELAHEITHYPLLKIFQDCTHYESCSGDGVDGEMSLPGFQLALVMIAQKLHFGQAQAEPLDQVQALFLRLNSVVASGQFGPRFGLLHEPLIPVPRQNSSTTRRDSSLRQSLLGVGLSAAREGADGGAGGKSSDMSWAGLMSG